MISIDYNILAEALASGKRRAARRCWRPSKIAECDGGAAAGGDAGAAASGDAGAASASSGATDSASSASGTSSTDVLGSCNHAAGDGYLGKDCFHIPAKCAVPFHRWEIGNGGSKRKKTKKGKVKRYAYEKGMKVVYDMLHEDDVKKVKIPKKLIKMRLKQIARSIKTMADAEAASRKFDANGTEKASKFPARFRQAKRAFLDIGAFLKDICTGNYRASWFTISLLAVAVVYVLSPIDLVPDAILGLGQIDDAMVIMWVFNALKDEFDSWKAKKDYRADLRLRDAKPLQDGEVDVGQMISEWNDTHLPRGRVNRHETGIPVKYWIAVDDYSEILNNYSCFVDWSLNLTPLANNHRPTFLTVDPSKIKELAKRAVAKWPDKYVFVGVDDSSRGMQTQKNHLRASVKYFWSPKYKMWNDALTFTESEEDVAKASVDETAGTFKKYDGKAIDWEQITEPATDAGSGESHVWLRTPDGVLVCRVDPPQEAQDDNEPSAYCIVDQDAGKLVEVGNGYPRGFTTFHFNYQPTHKEEIPADMPRA